MLEKTGHSRWVIGLGLGGIAAVFFGAAHLFPWPEWMRASQGWFDQHPFLGTGLYFLGFAMGVTFLFPGMLLGAGAGFLFGFWGGWAMASLAPLAAAAVVFLLSRRLAVRWMPERWRKDIRYRMVDQVLQDKGPWIIALLRLSPVIPFGLANVFYGMTSVRFGGYLLASWVGMLPGAGVAAWIGHTGGLLFFTSREPAKMEQAAFYLGLAVTVGVTWYVGRRVRSALAVVAK
jgi:uncharacterized membrane protein YdjX (TVP38/TMEM64 family)